MPGLGGGGGLLVGMDKVLVSVGSGAGCLSGFGGRGGKGTWLLSIINVQEQMSEWESKWPAKTSKQGSKYRGK